MSFLILEDSPSSNHVRVNVSENCPQNQYLSIPENKTNLHYLSRPRQSKPEHHLRLCEVHSHTEVWLP